MSTPSPFDTAALMQRREEMFGDHVTLATQEYVDTGVLGKVLGSVPVVMHPCNECGLWAVDKDAHFGWHLKIDNIDQRVVRASKHSHGPTPHGGPR